MTVTVDRRALDRAVEAARQVLERGGEAEPPTTGLAAGVVADGAVVWTGCHGLADIDAAQAVDERTAFRIGSITKLFTAIAVMQLVTEGVVDLDSPAAAYISAFRLLPKRGHRPVTVRELLTHVGGYGEWRSPRDALARRIPFAVPRDQPVPRMSHFYRRGLRPDLPPGEQYVYSNHGFAALGQLVEDVSGIAYADWVRRRILQPLGMTHSDVMLTDDVAARLAQGYVVADGVAHPVPYEHILIAPAGSIHSSITDMLRFAGWLTSDDDRVLPVDVRRGMASRHWQHDSRLPGSGLAFAIDTRRGREVAGHGGGWPGFVSELLLVPDGGVGVVALTNRFDLTARRVADVAIDAYLDGAHTTAGVAPARTATRACTGIYAPGPGIGARARWWTEHGGHVRVERSGDGLRLTSARGPYAGGVELSPVDADLWAGDAIRKGQPVRLRVRFDGVDGGRARSLLGALPGLVVMRRRPVASTWPGGAGRALARLVARVRHRGRP